MAVSSDPVGSALVTSLARPGGNVTGLATLAPELSTKRLELLREAVPNVSRVIPVWDPDIADRATEEHSLRSAAGAFGIELRVRHYRTPFEFREAIDAAGSWPADAHMILDDPLYEVLQFIIASQRTRLAIPTMAAFADFARSGGLMAYGPNIPDMFARSAAYVDKILKGAGPADLPVEQPRTFDFVINLKTAQALGLTISTSVLRQATEVIQ